MSIFLILLIQKKKLIGQVLFFADGYIQFKNENSSYTFELSLKGSDINHLYKFNKFMEHEGNNVKNR